MEGELEDEQRNKGLVNIVRTDKVKRSLKECKKDSTEKKLSGSVEFDRIGLYAVASLIVQ